MYIMQHFRKITEYHEENSLFSHNEMITRMNNPLQKIDYKNPLAAIAANMRFNI